MRKALPACALLLLSGAWALAQTTASATSSQSATAGQQPPGAQAVPTGHDNETVEGCLTGSGGTYTLTDSATGKTYQLTGDIATLNDHVGQEVRLTGSIAEATPSASGAKAGATFKVRKAKTLSESCTDRSR